MRRILVILQLIATVISIQGRLEDLHIEVVPLYRRFAAVHNINVLLKYSNTGNDVLGIYKWYLPTKSLVEPIFEITLDRERVNYVGPLVKRRAPTDADIIYIAPGRNVSTMVDLSLVYNMTETGYYKIEYKMNADHVVAVEGNEINRKNVFRNSGLKTVLQSAPVVVFSTGHRNPIMERSIRISTQTRALTPIYYSCTSAEVSAIKNAIVAAEAYAENALEHLQAQSIVTARYRTWFGAYSFANWQKLKSHFTNINNVLSFEELSFDCSCSSGDADTYAYVYPFLLYDINLCNLFWEASISGTDSQAGTLIHEIAHFTDTANTEDHAYGHNPAKTLAQNSPNLALMNSDNLQYFAENNPRLS